MKYIFLSKQFYNDYNSIKCPEIAQKENRPYVMLLMKIDGLTFAIPFRSHIRHSFSFITDTTKNSGVDYSKAIVVTDNIYIDSTRNPHIDNNEHKILLKKKKEILIEFNRYVEDYKKATSSNARRRNAFYRYSTLQYFHKELGL